MLGHLGHFETARSPRVMEEDPYSSDHADRNNLTCLGGQNPRTGNVNGSSGRNPTINRGW